MIPADLLDQLREKDPELWERMRRMPVYVHRDSSLTVDLTKSDNTELVDAWLQHCLQEAILWRGWAYQVSCTFQGTRFAKIATINPDGSKWFHDDQHAPTEAEALLRAYLAAIQEAA